jgi:hypothetical protein
MAKIDDRTQQAILARAILEYVDDGPSLRAGNLSALLRQATRASIRDEEERKTWGLDRH